MPLVCEVKLSKTDGVVVTITNADGKITQTISADGTTLKLEVAGESETSTFVQTAESIAITCKTFTLDAETVTVTSTKDTHHSSRQKFTVESTKDMALKTSTNLKIEAGAAAEAKAPQVTVKADATLTLESGATAKLDGGGMCEIKGGLVKLN